MPKTPSNAVQLRSPHGESRVPTARRTGGAPAGPGAEQRAARRASAHEANVGDKGSVGDGPPELHVCMGPQPCQGHDVPGRRRWPAWAAARRSSTPVTATTAAAARAAAAMPAAELEQTKPGNAGVQVERQLREPDKRQSRLLGGAQQGQERVAARARRSSRQRMYEAGSRSGPRRPRAIPTTSCRRRAANWSELALGPAPVRLGLPAWDSASACARRTSVPAKPTGRRSTGSR